MGTVLPFTAPKLGNSNTLIDGHADPSPSFVDFLDSMSLAVQRIITTYALFDGHHVEDYGAVGDGVTDDLAAITAATVAAVAGVKGSNKVIFGTKTYVLSAQLTINLAGGKSIWLQGAPGKVPQTGIISANASGTILLSTGGNDAIVIYSSAGAGDASNCHFTIENINLVAQGAAGNGLKIGYTGFQFGGGNKDCVIRNFGVHQFPLDQIRIINSRNILIDNVVGTQNISGTAGSAVLKVEAETGQFCGDINVLNCELVGSGTANLHTVILIPSGAGGQVRGIHFEDSTIYYGQFGMLINGTTANTQLGDIFIHGCQFDGINSGSVTTAISIFGFGANTVISGIDINNSYMVAWPARAVDVQNFGGGAVISNVNISENYINVGALGIVVNGVTATGRITGVHINHNRFYDMANTPITIQQGVTDSFITNNGHITTGGGVAGFANLINLTNDCDWLEIHQNLGRATGAAILNGTTGINLSIANNFAH